jgi:hypothetical protein
MAILERNRFPSRRAFARTLAGGVIARFGVAAEPSGNHRLTWIGDRPPAMNLERRYRADAHVLVLGLQILRREGVGGGSVQWSEFNEGGCVRLLEFNGYSSPERAAGLNRVGFIREMVRSKPDGGSGESIYFGVMTASPEESAEEARKALNSTAKELTYTAIDGRIGRGATETTSAHFTAPSTFSGRQCAELVERARRALAGVQTVVGPHEADECCHSFLHGLADLLQCPNRNEGRYIYSGRPYRIKLSRSADAKATAYFRERKLITQAAEVTRVNGRVRRESDAKETEFRLWVRAGDEHPLPLRIEYQPKSYLRLVLEAE